MRTRLTLLLSLLLIGAWTAGSRAAEAVDSAGRSGAPASGISGQGLTPGAGLALEPAYGAVVRRAATPPRVLVEELKGFFRPKAAVSIYAPDGSMVARGKVVDVIGGELYVDVAPSRYESIRSGFFVASNMTSDEAKEALAKHRSALTSIREDARRDEASYVAEREKAGIEKERADREMDRMNEESRLRVEEQRARDEDLYYRFGPYPWW